MLIPRVNGTNKKHLQYRYLSDNGFLGLKAAVPADKLIPCLSWYKDIIQFIYKVVFQGLSLLVYREKTTIIKSF